jgi:hypothetical protein
VADGAAVAAAQDVDIAAVYRSPAGTALPLSPRHARTDVDAFVRRAAVDTGLTDLQVITVDLDGPDVVVTLTGRSVLPLISTVSGDADGVLITVTARARAAVAR